jgi:serine/threonine protein kinase/Tol biopolymer transport system component
MLGRTLGQYRILEPLGKGGMGEVFLAEDTRLQRRVALKILAPELAADPDRRQRFEREARAAAQLNHPNIVTIHSVEEIDGIPFLTLELIEGQTLAGVIPAGGMALDKLLALAIPLADAVGAAHQRGITHRDLKPANVMVTTDGRVKVLDFGLAKLREDIANAMAAAMPTQEMTGEGRILGTIAYMSPEQAEGRAVDPRTDVFAIGVLLHEMATGDRPFKGDTQMSVLSAIIKDTPASVTDVKPELPRDLARIIRHCLAKDPEDRYQTAKDLRNDLRALKEDLASGDVTTSIAASSSAGLRSADARVTPPTQTATTIAPSVPAQTPLWRHPIVIAALILVAGGVAWLALGSGTESATPASGSAQNARPFDSVTLTRLTTTGTAGLAALSPDGRYAAYVVSDTGASLWLRQVQTASNVQIVPPAVGANYDGVTFSQDGNYIYYVVYPAGQNLAALYQVPVLGGGARKIIDDIDCAPSFSPDGKRFAFLRGEGDASAIHLMIADAAGTNARILATRKAPLGFGNAEAVSWSPDGKTIAAPGINSDTLKANVVLINAETGAESTLGSHDWRSVAFLSWLPDGNGLVVNAVDAGAEASSQIWSLTYPAGEVARITNDLSTYSGVGLSGDGNSFVSVRNETRTRLWTIPDGDLSKVHEITAGAGTDDGVRGFAWTPDKRIVYASSTAGNTDIWIMNPDGSNRVQLTNSPAAEELPLVSPDGKTIVFVSERDGPRTIFRMNVDGSSQAKLGAGVVMFRPVISFDGKWVYYSDAKRQNFRIPIEGGTPQPLLAELTAAGRPLPPGFHEPIPSPDGKALAGHYQDPEKNGERIVVLSTDTSAPERRFPDVPANARWAPDGRSLVFSRSGNLYQQPIAGGPPAQVTKFTGDRIFSFAVSMDQKQLGFVRGQVVSDVVLVTRKK